MLLRIAFVRAVALDAIDGWSPGRTYNSLSSMKMAPHNSNPVEARHNRDYFSYKEMVFPGLKYEMQLKRVLVSTNSEFQEIDIVETCFGKVR